jgi:hypothetical protein
VDEGLDLTGTTAPVNVRRSAVRGVLSPLLSSSSFYADAAGGFDQVHATPAGPRFTSATGALVVSDAQMTELYQMGPQYVRQRLEQQFGIKMPARPSTAT